MKSLVKTFVLVIALILVSAQSYAQKSNSLYKAKSGIIEYKLSGKTTGTETLYFDDNGKKEATFTKSTTKIMGMTSSENKLSLRLDSVLYDINLEDNTGVRTVIPFDPSELTEEEMKELEETGKKLMEEMGFEKTGQEKILGRTCDIWEGMNTKIWIWENLTLKTEVNMLGQFITEAVNIEINPRIPDDKFKLPAGVELVDELMDSYDMESDKMDEDEIDSLDSLGNELGKELEKGLNELKGILGVKKKKK